MTIVSDVVRAWKQQTHFCLVRRPNEKRHVERLLDFARRNILVRVPRDRSVSHVWQDQFERSTFRRRATVSLVKLLVPHFVNLCFS